MPDEICKYDIALIEKEGVDGLNFNDIAFLYALVSTDKYNEVFPIEIEAKEHECSAMGFITTKAAGIIDYDYKGSGFADFIASILDDMELEEKLAVDSYTVKDVVYRIHGKRTQILGIIFSPYSYFSIFNVFSTFKR